ncbi:TolC family protein [cyanobacterium G8-9]|nr:TolC family protein [cyanobacterium G8-9]
MKKTLWLLVLMLSQGLNAQTLTLDDAIAKTLTHHPDVKNFMLRIQQAEQGYNSAYAAYLPQIDASATYSPSQTYVLPVNGTFNTINDSGWNVGISMRQKVWDFAKTASLVDASKKDEDISKLSLKEVKALLAYKVKSLYELLVVQREAIHVRQKDLEAKRAFYDQSKALVKQGLKTNADSHRFLSSVYAAEDNLAIAKASFEKAKTSLSLYMGREIASNVKLQSSALKKNVSLSKEIEHQILTNNYRVKMDALSVEKNRLLHKSAKSAHWGSIDVVASHSRVDTLNSYDTDYIGVSYNIPLYSGGRLSAQEQQAKIGYQIAQEQQASDTLSIKEELRALVIDIKRYAKTIKAKKAQLRSAQSAQKVLNARYKEGLATYIEVLDSTTQVLNAQLGVLETYYSRSLALDRLEYLKGNI